MDGAFRVSVNVARKNGNRFGYIHGYLNGNLEGIKDMAISDMDLSENDYDLLIAYARKLKEDFDEGKSI